MKERRMCFKEIHEIFKRAYPYADLTIEDIKKVLSYMDSRPPRLAWVSFEDELVEKPRRSEALYNYYFNNLSMIPNKKQYLVVDDPTESAVGVLDEQFIAEYGKPGVKFVIRGSPWKILDLANEKIYVKAVDDPAGAIPSWIGEEIPVPFEVAQEVGRIRSLVEDQMEKGIELEDIAAQLTKEYPAEKDTIARALLETCEHTRKGYPVPTDKKIVIEDWEDFVIIHANFGSLTNRAMAQLIGHLLSEQTGYTIEVKHDPYRIFVRGMNIFNGDRIVSLSEDIKEMTELEVKETITRATVKTGLFKRRMIQVAQRFGALEKEVDFTTISLTKLIKSFEDTAIFDEALKETFTKDLGIENTRRVIAKIRKGEIEIIKLETHELATPIARVGVERESMKTDIIRPERLRLLLVESAKARLLNEVRTFICTECWEYLETNRIKDLPDAPTCPVCDSTKIGLLDHEEEKLHSIVIKKGEKLTRKEKTWKKQAVATSRLMVKHGKAAAVALSGRRVSVSDVEDILSKEEDLTGQFYELVLEAERKALKRRFW
jgi:ATP-dependent Lhr-like helicase